jgi:hypothetical protein
MLKAKDPAAMTRAPTTRPTVNNSAPAVPEDTCPYIDMVLEAVDRIADCKDDSWRRQQVELAGQLLEHIRAANLQLRTSSKYWHDRAKRV